jgi:hypothetical protein
VTVIRYPEARAKRASKDAQPTEIGAQTFAYENCREMPNKLDMLKASAMARMKQSTVGRLKDGAGNKSTNDDCRVVLEAR